MLRNLISYLLIFSLMFLGVESAMDVTGNEHSHSGSDVHLADGDSSQVVYNDDGEPDREYEDKQTQHCCYGHSADITKYFIATNVDAPNQQFPYYNFNSTSFTSAPPTPPPDA